METISQQINHLPSEATAHLKRTGLPLVTLSYAQSIDGCLTLKQGEPSPVSGKESTHITHQLRSVHDAILVGVGTLLADNPSLTARGVNGDSPRPIIVDSQLRTPTTAAILDNPKGLIIATTEQASVQRQKELQTAGATIWVLKSDPVGRVSLPDLLEKLGSADIASLMVEGGSHIISSFLREQLADQAVITIAPVFAGGYHVIQNLAVTEWQALPSLSDISVTTIGKDLIVWGYLNR